MKALITGSAGFVGRHMAVELARRGYDTFAVDTAEGRDAIDLFRYADATRYDLIVHAAASAPHRAAIDGEHTHMARNLQLDAAMFNWAVHTGQGRVLYLSSSAAYPVAVQRDETCGRLDEDAIDVRWGVSEPDSVYGWTKLTGERMAAEARKAGLSVTVVRPFSGYGEDQSENFPFRALIERARRGEDPFQIWGDGNQVRDWIHISDVVNGALAVVTAQAALEADPRRPVNLCTGVGTSMRELAHMACAYAGHEPRFELLADRPSGVAYRVGDPTRFFGYYRPKVTLEDGIRRALNAGA